MEYLKYYLNNLSQISRGFHSKHGMLLVFIHCSNVYVYQFIYIVVLDVSCGFGAILTTIIPSTAIIEMLDGSNGSNAGSSGSGGDVGTVVCFIEHVLIGLVKIQ